MRLRGRDFLEKFTTPAKKALADLTLTPKTNAASVIEKPPNARLQRASSEGPEGTSGEEKTEKKQ